MENNDIKTVDELLNNWKIINLDFYNSKIKINNSFLDNISTLNSKNELSVSIDNILDCHIALNSLLITLIISLAITAYPLALGCTPSNENNTAPSLAEPLK